MLVMVVGRRIVFGVLDNDFGRNGSTLVHQPFQNGSGLLTIGVSNHKGVFKVAKELVKDGVRSCVYETGSHVTTLVIDSDEERLGQCRVVCLRIKDERHFENGR